MYRGIPRFYFFPKNSDVECLFLCLPIEYMCILHIFFGEVPFKSLPIFRIRLFAFLFLSLESLKWIIGVNLLAHKALQIIRLSLWLVHLQCLLKVTHGADLCCVCFSGIAASCCLMSSVSKTIVTYICLILFVVFWWQGKSSPYYFKTRVWCILTKSIMLTLPKYIFV